VAQPINETDALNFYLSTTLPPPGNGISCLLAALRDARKDTNRDLITGTILTDIQHHGNWLGTVGYCTVLDQIGTSLGRRDYTPSSNRKLIRALENFHPVRFNPNEANTLYALRCCFAHEFNLFNKNAKEPALQHHFRVTENSGVLIVNPSIPWNGVYTNRSHLNATTVDLQEFGDLVEGLISNIINLNQQSDVSIILQDGPEELISRYTLNIVRAPRP